MAASKRPDAPEFRLPDAELRALVQLAPQLLSLMEPDGSVSWVNDGALEYFGLDPCDVGDVRTQVIHPDDFAALDARRREVLARGIPFDAEQRMRGKDGQYRRFLVRYRPLKEGDRVVRWFGWATDVEDLRRAEDAAWRSATYLAEAQRLSQTDRVQLQQVFMNLVLNAIEALEGTGGQVAVRSEPQGDAAVVVSVSDTGPGLAPESRGAIFDPFFTTKPQGTGMGLSICRTIVESHGGKLWAESAPGSGATFRFSLPVHAR